MNLWVKNSGLLIAVALFLFSCDDITDLGDSINPNGDKVGVYYAEIPISSSTILLDSINSKNTGNFLVGKHQDPDFGKISATSYSRILPAVSNPSVPDGMIVDSVVLSLRYNYFYGDDFTTPQKIHVHGLTEDVDFKTAENTAQQYYTFDKTSFSPEVIGAKSFAANPQTDSILRIPLDVNNLLVNQWLSNARGYKLDTTSIDAFYAQVKGVALVPDENNSVVFGFDSKDADSRISVFYHTAEEDSLTVDFKFYIEASNAVNWVTNYINIEADRTGTPLAGIVPRTEFQTNDDRAYLQAGTGIATKLNIDGFNNFLDTAKNIIINKLELELGSVNPFSKFYEPPTSLIYFYTDETNRIKGVNPNLAITHSNTDRLLVEVQRQNANPIPFQPQISDETYSGEISNFGFTYASREINVTELLAQPAGLASSLRRATIPSDKLKLKIYYTKLN